MVTLDTSTFEGVDRALVETSCVVHTPVDVVLRVVVNLTFDITDNRLSTPHIVVLTTFATAEDARLERFRNTLHCHRHLSSVVGEEQVATISAECLECVDDFCRSQVARKVCIAMSHTDAVAHHPAHGFLLDVEVVDSCRREENTCAIVHIVLLEPCHCGCFVSRLLIVVWHEHSHLSVSRTADVGQTVASEQFQLVLEFVGSTHIPFVSSKTYSQNTSSKFGGWVEVDDTCAAVVNHVVPCTKNG